MNNNNSNIKTFLILIFCLAAGMLLGRMINNNWQNEVNNKVEEELSKVIMMDVPMIDKEVSLYLANNNYNQKYMTAIDLADLGYGIYKIENNDVVAYAHGKCQSVGSIGLGTYKIVKTKSHLDYDGVRYWRVVELEEIHTGEEIIVSTPGYEIAEAPIKLSEKKTDLNNIEIGNEIMLSVYENSEPGTLLLVVDSENGELFDGTNHKH